MVTKTTTIINQSGLHARPASMFTQAAAKFKSRIKVSRPGAESKANAKSIMFLLSLGLCKGEQVEITAEGIDEEEAVSALIALIDSGLGEA